MNQSFPCLKKAYCRTSLRSMSFASTREFLSHRTTLVSEKSRSIDSDLGLSLKHRLTTESDLLEITRLPSHPYNTETAQHDVLDMRWYRWWLSDEISRCPENLFSVLPTNDSDHFTEELIRVWTHVSPFLSNNGTASIDDLIQYLESKELLDLTNREEGLRSARDLLFTILGWQTMLFRADSGSSPANILSIAQVTSGHDRRTFVKLRASHATCREPLYRCLTGFGLLLPPPNCNLSNVAEHRKTFNELRDITSSDLNAFILTKIGHVEIRWTNLISCHLEFDIDSNILYLFRYPSFCIANKSDKKINPQILETIYACARPQSERLVWSTKDEISGLMSEILASYRLLFGQKKVSRTFFRNLEPFEGIPNHAHDQALIDLCGRKHSRIGLTGIDRRHWDLKHDFPILRSRLSILAYEMSRKKPRSWLELWRDRRDSAQWATFWTVFIFGGFSLLLSLLQVLLQAVQLAQH